MKTFVGILFLVLSNIVAAEVCTTVIKDQRSNYEFETFTRTSYSKQAACDMAIYDCQTALSTAQSYGRYYGAICEIKYTPSPSPSPYPNPYPRTFVCQTDLVDYYSNVVRTFTAPGANEYDACNTSDIFCKSELARNDSYGARCVNRGLIDSRNDPRPPSRTKTEQCTASRLDPAGMFIQSYMATATGPINSDVRGEACRNAFNDCSRDLRGRQTCNINR
jgi:hypothetical protein